MLTKRKGNDLDTAMKRPASKKTLAKAEPKQKAIVKKNAEEAKHVTPVSSKESMDVSDAVAVWVAVTSASLPTLGGLSLSSRQEYNKWYQEKQHGIKRKCKHFLCLTKDRGLPCGK